MNEAPYSFNVKVIDRNNYDTMFTIRDEDGQQFFQRVTNLLNWLPANGYTPTGNGRRQTSPAPQDANVPVCQFHGPMKPSKYGGYFCPSKMGDGSYCKEKVTGPAQPAPAPQPVQHANGTPPPPLAMFDDAPPPDSYYNEHN